MDGAPLEYRSQESPLTLKEGLDEYYRVNQGLLDPASLPPDTALLFRQHDAGHVVFGCDTSPRGEAMIDIWTIAGTTAGLRGYLEYFEHPQVNQIFADAGYWRLFVESIRAVPDMFRVFLRSRQVADPWPWQGYERFLETPLAEIRREFRIRVV
jgi:hypothetical protein